VGAVEIAPAGLVMAGHVTDHQLITCYRHATLAVQPSLMEGFGLAALEAMRLGCPFWRRAAGR
jgi:glycosyltransferase involved in cell wall biosynthesis